MKIKYELDDDLEKNADHRHREKYLPLTGF